MYKSFSSRLYNKIYSAQLSKFSWKKSYSTSPRKLEILEKEHFFKSTTFEFDAILLHPFFKKGASYAFTPLVNFCQAIPPKHFAHIALQKWVWWFHLKSFEWKKSMSKNL